jgi:hypothetical protein
MSRRIGHRLVALAVVATVTAVAMAGLRAAAPAMADHTGVSQNHPVAVAEQPAHAALLRPDLYVRSPIGITLQASPGSTPVSVGLAVGNEGRADATAVRLIVMLPGGLPIGQVGAPSGWTCTPPSAAGAGTQVKCAGDMRAATASGIQLQLLPSVTPLGSYQIQALIDPGNAILESDEADNSAVLTVRFVK